MPVESDRMDGDDREYWISQLMDDPNGLLGTDVRLHVQAVLKKLPLDDLRKLAETNIVLFSQDRNYLGRVFDALPSERPVLYLSPELLSKPEGEIRGVIAHEFAHSVLDQEGTPSKDAASIASAWEESADRLAESWGFPLPASYRAVSYTHLTLPTILRV